MSSAVKCRHCSPPSEQLRAFVLWVKTARDEEKAKAMKEGEGEMDDEESEEESSDTTSQL